MFILVLARNLYDENRRHRPNPTAPFANVLGAPHGHIGSANITAELHPSLVASHDELRVLLGPRSEDERHVYGDILLIVGAGRHVEELPCNVLETTIDLRPRGGFGRIDALGVKLNREAHSDESDTSIVRKYSNRRSNHFIRT
jgi:hypothetical protein